MKKVWVLLCSIMCMGVMLISRPIHTLECSGFRRVSCRPLGMGNVRYFSQKSVFRTSVEEMYKDLIVA